MSAGFSLRFPFSLSPGFELNGPRETITKQIEGITLKLEKSGQQYAITFQNLSSEDKAREFIRDVWAGLAWVTVNSGIGFTASMELDEVTYADDPTKAAENLSASFGEEIEGPVDGLAGGQQPVVFPDGKRLRFISLGNPSVIIDAPSQSFCSKFMEGLSLPRRTEVYSDIRLRTALELYSAYYYEHSGNARLLTLVMVLETLTLPTPKAAIALDLMIKWHAELQEAKGRFDATSEQYKALESLERELLFRRDASLRSSIRQFVVKTLAADGIEVSEDLGRRVVDVYDKRSTLVHEGRLDDKVLSTAQAEAKLIVEATLKARLRRK
jgi:hypothetical protein